MSLAACGDGRKVPVPAPTTVYEGPAACAMVPVPRVCTAFTGGVSAKAEPTVAKVAGWENERYELDTRTEDIHIRAGSDEGVLRARTTLALLRRGDTVPRRLISDSPRFAWRGLLLDVARHPFTVEDIEAVIDRMALVKLRVLHLHLSDDQGFRLELASHPELARKGGTRTADGNRVSFTYTKLDIARLVAHAKRRFVEIVPEIDLPGHTLAILASHPELSCKGGPFEVPSAPGIYEDVLCMGNPATLPFVLEVLTEVASLFPSRYVHIGGDEVPTSRWESCEKCRAAMRGANLTTPRALQGAFTKRVSDHLARLGKTAIGWDEALELGAPDRMPIMVWRRREVVQKALHEGHDVLLAPNDRTYLDARPTEHEYDLLPSTSGPRPGASRVLPWETVMQFDPSEGETRGTTGILLGGEAALWTENVTSLAEIDALLFPRLLPIAEALWLGTRAHADVDARAYAMADKLETLGVRAFVAPPDLPEQKLFADTVEVAVPSSPLYGGRVEIALDDGPFTSYANPPVLTKSTRVRSVRITKSGQRSAIRESAYTKATPSPARATPGTTAGMAYRACAGAYSSARTALTCASPIEGIVKTLQVPPGLPATDFAVTFRAVVVVPETGIYSFSLASDDGAILRVDDTAIVDLDGVHAARERHGEAALAKGAHALDVSYFQGKGGATLALKVRGPGIADGEGESLFRVP